MESICIKRFLLNKNNFLFLKFNSFLVLKDRSPISQLPDEILLRIFKYNLNVYDLFHSCITVSKQWKFIINDKTIWKTVNPINWSRGSLNDFSILL